MITRRGFFVVLGSLAAAGAARGGLRPPAARAQPASHRARVVAFTGVRVQELGESLRQGLRDVGYEDGRNLSLEWRYDEGTEDRTGALAALAGEIVRSRPDAIVVGASEARLRAVRDATAAIPIVFIALDFDPVAHGYVASLARPGRNLTGLFVRQPELAAKRMEVLHEALPRARRVAVLWDSFSADQWRAAEGAGRPLGLQLQAVELRAQPYDLAEAFRAAERGRAEALLVSASPAFYRERGRLAELGTAHRVAVVGPASEFADAGALLSYGIDQREVLRHAAVYLGKLLRGSRPADLPVEQPTTFDLIVNLKTASALGIAVPPAVLLRATRAID